MAGAPTGTVAGSAGSLLISRVVVAAAGWAGTVVIARELSPADWGGYSLIFGVLGILALVVDLQVGRVVLRRLVPARDDAGAVLGSYTSLRIVMGVVALVAGIGFVAGAGYDATIIAGTAVVGTGMVFMSPAAGLRVWFQARLWMHPVAVASVLGALVQLALVLVVTTAPRPTITRFAAAFVAGQVMVLAWQVRALRRQHVTFSLRVEPRVWWVWLKEAVPIAIGFGLATLYYKLDIVMLGQLDTLTAVGQYGIGYKFADFATYLPIALLNPVLTVMVSAWPDDGATLRRHFRQAFVVLFVAGVAIAVGFALVAHPLVELVYGARFLPAVGAARLLVAAATIQFFTHLAFVTLVAIGRNRPYALVCLAGLAVNAGLNLALIPRHSFRGSAVATVITECLVAVVLLVALARSPGVVVVPWQVITRTLTAGLAMAAAYLGVAVVLPWPVAAVVSGAAFLAVLHALGTDGPGGLRALARSARFEAGPGEARPEP